MSEAWPGIKLCIVISPAFAMEICYRGQLEYMMKQGCQLTMVSDVGREEHEAIRRRGIRTHILPMERNPSFVKDIVSLVRLWSFFLRHRFDVIQVSTPKASFLGALAARMAGQNNVVYLVRGRPYEYARGLRRKYLSGLDSITCKLSRLVVPNSEGLRTSLAEDGICKRSDMVVVGHGSSIGVDVDGFSRTGESMQVAAILRRKLSICVDDVVVLFVGWLRKEKGIDELVSAFVDVSLCCPKAHLVLLGNEYTGDAIAPETRTAIASHLKIHWLERRADILPVYHAADVLVLPSWREGFARVVLEGAASSLPAIVTDAPGCSEGVVDGESGLVVPVRNPKALGEALFQLVSQKEVRLEMGRMARRIVEEHFRQESIWEGHWSLLREVAGGATDSK